MSNNKKNSIKCPFEDKLKPQTGAGRVGSVEDARIEGSKHVPSDADIYSSVSVKSGGGRLGTSGTIMRKDSRRKGRDFNKTAQQAADERHEIRPGETHTKSSVEEDSAAIVCGDYGAIMQSRGGLVAVGVSESSGAMIQGELTISSKGKAITKGWFTENPMSFLASTGLTPTPALLFKMPDLSLFENGFVGELTSFILKFYKG